MDFYVYRKLYSRTIRALLMDKVLVMLMFLVTLFLPGTREHIVSGDGEWGTTTRPNAVVYKRPPAQAVSLAEGRPFCVALFY